MKTTGELAVLGDLAQDEGTINIHPNDAFDLGLMTTEYKVQLCVGTDADVIPDDDTRFRPATIFLRNEVRGGYVELGMKAAEKLGGSTKAKLLLDDSSDRVTLRIVPV